MIIKVLVSTDNPQIKIPRDAIHRIGNIDAISIDTKARGFKEKLFGTRNIIGFVKDEADIPDIIKNEVEYVSFVSEHITSVKSIYNKTYVKVRALLMDKYKDENAVNGMMPTTIKLHDISKFSKAEFSFTRIQANPTEFETMLIEKFPNIRKLIDAGMNKAWLNHIHRNNHHPEFWVIINNKDEDDAVTPIDMTVASIIEMLCDWKAIYTSNGGTIEECWESVKSTKYLSKDTIAMIKYLIPAFSDS